MGRQINTNGIANMNEHYRKEMLAEFVRFLKERGAYATYLVYINKECGYYRFFEVYVNSAYRNTEEVLRGLISSAFAWNHTKEGEEFWYNLHIEWIHKLNERHS